MAAGQRSAKLLACSAEDGATAEGDLPGLASRGGGGNTLRGSWRLGCGAAGVRFGNRASWVLWHVAQFQATPGACQTRLRRPETHQQM